MMIEHLWICFYLCLAVCVITSVIMVFQGRRFYYYDGKVKKFSMLNLEFAPDRCYLYFVFRQIAALPSAQALDVRRAVKAQLYTDFIFMPGTYLGVALLCVAVARRYQGAVHDLFTVLIWLEFLSWLMDIIENIYLLKQLKQPTLLTQWGFRAFQLMEFAKWLPSGGGFLAAIFFLNLH